MIEEHESQDAEMAFNRALEAVRQCFVEGPTTGVLITFDNERAVINMQTLNHDFTKLFDLLMSTMQIVHERQVAGTISKTYNLQ